MTTEFIRNSIAEIVFSAAQSAPHQTAIIVPGFTLDYASFANVISVFAKELHDRGVTRGSFLAFQFRDDFALICAALAASLIGCRWIVRSRDLSGTVVEHDMTHIVHDIPNAKFQTPQSIYIGSWSFDRKLNSEFLSMLPLSGYSDPEQIWRVASSSGSTGKPKFIGTSIGAALKGTRVPREQYLPENPVIAHLFSPKATVGMNWILRTFVWRGTAILSPTVELLSTYQPAQVVGSPALIAKLLSQKTKPHGKKIPYVVSTGSPLTEPFVNLALDHFDNLINHFGCTELGRVATSRITERIAGPYSAGKLFADVLVEIVDEADNPKPLGDDGIVRIRKPNMVHSYLYDGEGRSAEIFRDGWFYSGDTGFLDTNGELFITGRVRDTLNLGGKKISAQTIDEQVLATPGVSDCMSFSEVDGSAISTLSVLIVCEPEHSVEDIRAHIYSDFMKRHDKYACPKRLYFVNKLPRNSNGKIMRHTAEEVARGVEPVLVFHN